MKSTKKKPISAYARFAALSDAEKEATYRALDHGGVAERSKPLSGSMKKIWSRAKRKAGRPRVGRGAQRVLISVEQGLLEQVDAFAQRRKISRSELFSRGVKSILAKPG